MFRFNDDLRVSDDPTDDTMNRNIIASATERYFCVASKLQSSEGFPIAATN